jgi:hypothetical protein
MVRFWRALIPVAVIAAAGCQGSSHPAAVAPTTTSGAATTVTSPGGPGSSTTVSIPIQASGPRTVLSPIGLNLRSQPSKTAPVAGTAAQGAVVTVLSHTDQGGGWYQVKGATVTGYITDNPALSADGKFAPYDSTQHNFAALYPGNWTSTEVPPASVVFHPATGADSIVVTTAATAALLGRGRAGYRQDSSSVVVVCGVTGDLVTYSQTNANAAPATTRAPAGGAVVQRYLVQVHLTLDAQHALGLDANLADLAQVQTVKNVLYSLSFPFPQCEQGAAPSDASTTVPASTVP